MPGRTLRVLGAAATAMLLLTFLVTAPAGAATACTISWANAAGGSWTTATNWSPARLPVDGDDVCITAAGTYSVQFANPADASLSVSLRSLTVGAAKAHPTLQLVGQQPNPVVGGLGVGLSATTATVAKTGIVQLTAVDFAAIVSLAYGTMTNSGRITTLPRQGGTSTLAGSLTNQGTLDVQATTIVRGEYTDVLTNNGVVRITGAGNLLTLLQGPEPSFVNAPTGVVSIAAPGRMQWSSGYQSAGRTAGVPPELKDITFLPTGSGKLLARSIDGSVVSMHGDIPSTQTVTVDGQVAYGGTATNAGTIALQSSTTAGSVLSLSSTLTNTGTVTLLKGAGGPQKITGSGCTVVNAGSLVVAAQALSLDCALSQQPNGTVAVTVAGTPATGRFGSVASTSSASLAGTLAVTTTPAKLQKAAHYPIMSFTPIQDGSSFLTVHFTGLPFHSVDYDFNVGTVTLVAP